MQALCPEVENPRLLMAMAQAGGALTLYGQPLDAGSYRYKVLTIDQTPMFLAAGGPTIKRDSGWLLNWAAAIKSLSRYPWPQLTGMYVDPNMGRKIWSAIQEYQQHSPRPVRSGALERWRQVCGI